MLTYSLFCSTNVESGFDSFLDYYIQPHIRALPYIWGILVGYILFKLRGKKLEISWVIVHITNYDNMS